MLMSLLILASFSLIADPINPPNKDPFPVPPPEEGMYPLSEISKLDLVKAGLEIPVSEIYNPAGNSLVEALVRVGGCTGSFISGKGLIITNHHCAFSATAAASSPENNYLRDGFHASARENEIPAKSLTVRITDSYEDVSVIVLKGTTSAGSALERLKLIGDNIKALVNKEEEAHPDREIEISEMLTGKSYVLFRYKMIRDIRLVYIPPRAIGEFGGETDNWEWPRHTGDFSLMRAYVAKDGSPAEYSEENVEYEPEKHLHVNPNGALEDDFVFILGYPGRTMRNRPAKYLTFQENHILPYVSEVFDWLIDEMKTLGDESEEKKLRYASRIKSLANTTKNFKGKLRGLNRTGLVQEKYQQENALQAFINKDPKLKAKYKDVIPEMNLAYDKVLDFAELNLWSSLLNSNSNKFKIAAALHKQKMDLAMMSKKEQKAYYKSHVPGAPIIENFDPNSVGYDEGMEDRFLKMMFDFGAGINKNGVDELKSLASNSDYLDVLMDGSLFSDMADFSSLAKRKAKKIFKKDDPFVALVGKIIMSRNEMIGKLGPINANINKLMPEYLEVKALMLNNQFIPDANGTLRLTYGHVRGYSPQDAIEVKPFTTLAGLLEKGNGAEEGADYYLPRAIMENYESAKTSRFAHPEYGDVPVGILYDMDTTGGNSGSPIMNAKGELIGVNFDRAITATINDFAWNEAYSRSIGVDIRYILWYMQQISGAHNLLAEMGVE